MGRQRSGRGARYEVLETGEQARRRGLFGRRFLGHAERSPTRDREGRLFRFLVRASRDLWAFLLGEGRFPRHSHLSPEDPEGRTGGSGPCRSLMPRDATRCNAITMTPACMGRSGIHFTRKWWELRLGCHPETPIIEPCPDAEPVDWLAATVAAALQWPWKLDTHALASSPTG